MTTAAARFATPGFGPENLPYAVFSPGSQGPRLGARLGRRIIDLAALATTHGGLPESISATVSTPNLDALLAAGHESWTKVRSWLGTVVRADGLDTLIQNASYPLEGTTLHMPFSVADYVDHYASEEHAANVGKMFRPDREPLLPNWKHLPVGYHGRAGTVRLSGQGVIRPKGLRPEPDGRPSFGPTRKLDIEAEIGFVLGGSAPGGEVTMERASEEHLFGLVLFNDWSARDIQNFEYVPLGPHLGKSFASTISPWVVPWEALAAARVEPPHRDVPLAAYLDDTRSAPWGLDITMEILIDGEVISSPPVRTMYWTAPQMVAHMSVNGAGIRPGDFFGSGTVSGPEKNQLGSLLELSWSGKKPLVLADGREITFLEDGHRVTLRGTAPGPDGSLIDFGECSATVLPSSRPDTTPTAR